MHESIPAEHYHKLREANARCRPHTITSNPLDVLPPPLLRTGQIVIEKVD
jgi:hypothetical protein